ncbi:GNAT family N-acetyltransferase [Janthinobacterium fluminis]|uniref:GNAT family protein n=1 Tax=Janthinobacterium fluminis TaxID=2987524 RepID=A0ABT5K118_9BURK|nr:GNAT family protein [Janthinobacterium fluminis]MDC8758673.1 GNAT family protein [Janthinobacterium fluminis]
MLKGTRCNLRPFKEADLDPFIEALNDVGTLSEYSSIRFKSGPALKREFQETALLGEHNGRLLIEDKQGRMVGDIGYFPSNALYDGFEIGYKIYKVEDRGQGYASDALKSMVRYLFMTRYFHRLQITFIAGHGASEKVAQKCGFTKEGVARGASTENGTPMDVVVYSLLRPEFEAL